MFRTTTAILLSIVLLLAIPAVVDADGPMPRKFAARLAGEAVAGLDETQPAEVREAMRSAVVTLLSDPSPALRAGAARDLGRLRHSAAVGALTLAAGDGEPDLAVRTTAISALSWCGGPQAGAALGAMLYDSKPAIRIAAARGLTRVKSPIAGAVLQRVLENDPQPNVRAAAATALGWQANPAAGGVLMKALRQDENLRVRASAAASLGLLGDASARPALRDALADPDPLVRYQAIGALDRLGADEPTRRELAGLAKNDPDPAVRRRAATALSDPRPLPAKPQGKSPTTQPAGDR